MMIIIKLMAVTFMGMGVWAMAIGEYGSMLMAWVIVIFAVILGVSVEFQLKENNLAEQRYNQQRVNDVFDRVIHIK
jgi:hypothetical protein